jgi:hypothetical protein
MHTNRRHIQGSHRLVSRPIPFARIALCAAVVVGVGGRLQAQAAAVRNAPGGLVVPRGDPTQYALELVSLKGDKIWFAGIGDRDAIALTLLVSDGDTGSTVTIFRKVRNGQIVPLDFQRVFGPKPVNGQLEIQGNLTITHPQKFENMKNAVKELYDASQATAEVVGSEKKDDDLILVSKMMKKEQVEKLVVDVSTELMKVAGRVACGGANPITIDLPNRNTLDLGEIRKLAGGTAFKLLSFHKGAQIKTCFRNIVYDPISARIVRK